MLGGDFLINYLLICRSLTYAQRTARALEKAGIAAMVVRTPGNIHTQGCGYCVKIPEKRLSEALVTLKRHELSPSKIYMMYSDGRATEVPL
jgi:NADH/NAD ratio-sensing transcriptional regulator Rex